MAVQTLRRLVSAEVELQLQRTGVREAFVNRSAAEAALESARHVSSVDRPKFFIDDLLNPDVLIMQVFQAAERFHPGLPLSGRVLAQLLLNRFDHEGVKRESEFLDRGV